VTERLLIERVEVGGRPGRSVLIVDGRVERIGGPDLTAAGATVLDGAGGALLPGLNDHHLHLFASAAVEGSLPCGPGSVQGEAGLTAALRTAAAAVPPGRWVRAIGYDEGTAGRLTSALLDHLLGDLADRAIRVQHRSGHAWVLNATAMRLLGIDPSDGVLLDADELLRDRLGGRFPDLRGLSRTLAGYGITGICDASVHNGATELAELRRAADAGELLQRCHVMGTAELDHAGAHGLVSVGPRKIVLADHALPALDDLVAQVRQSGSRGVAIHAVTLESLLLAATALSAAGGGGHRIEHASVAPPPAVVAVTHAGARVVTQPGFVARHGNRYLRTVEADDLPWMYRIGGWLEAGVPLAAGSDSPYGPLDPWSVMRAATERRTDSGTLFGADEAVEPEAALQLFTSPLAAPGALRRAPAVDDPADLCLLAVGWAEARRALTADLVAVTIVAGRPVGTV
jgi:predicted amidohydrolase YtcJ